MDSRGECPGVTRECEHQVMTRCKAAEYEGSTLASSAFGDVYNVMFYKPQDREELQFVRRVPQLPEEVQAASVTMGPPPGKSQDADIEVKPRSLYRALRLWPCLSGLA